MRTFSKESLQNLIAAHPESVQQLFSDFGLNKQEISPEDIYQAYLAFGDRFLTRLYELIENQWENADGLTAEDEAAKSQNYQKEKSWLDKLLEETGKIGEIIGDVREIIRPGTKPVVVNPTASEQQPQDINLKKYMLYAGIGIVVLIVLIVVLKYAKK